MSFSLQRWYSFFLAFFFFLVSLQLVIWSVILYLLFSAFSARWLCLFRLQWLLYTYLLVLRHTGDPARQRRLNESLHAFVYVVKCASVRRKWQQCIFELKLMCFSSKAEHHCFLCVDTHFAGYTNARAEVLFKVLSTAAHTSVKMPRSLSLSVGALVIKAFLKILLRMFQDF